MSSNLREFREQFRLDDLTIYQTDHWTWSVRPVHCTIGSGILSAKKFHTAFADLSEDEHIDLGVMLRHIQKKLASSFEPEKMNFLMLMMVDNHVHFHVIPRYSETKTFGGFEWKDSGWPKLPSLGDYEDRAKNPILNEIKEKLA